MTTNAVTITAPEGLPFIDMTREFDAPVEAVYRAHTEPDLLTLWLGPRGYDMTIERFEMKAGGRYRYLHTDPEGVSYTFNGVVHVARPNELIIQTFEFEGFPDIVSLETMRLEDLGEGRTLLSAHSVYPSVEARDGMAASGMEQGVTEGYEKLDEVLANLSVSH
ncbi:SRPBCC family protein [Pengzhenrongella frigida]|uniref:Polyketide cyclase n=1 Tax=Pengzhenrongella frigida TaxID=1259133 RepID=A0A4Q5MW45_9MICO|nr:SRPBCC family protein [Cellulomonas sp. HLT2-17]RYV49780.1 polyketide cyclase [Cellulomonas sp. HLT2-17]